MDIQAWDGHPSTAQIERACRLYNAGATPADFRLAFAGELTSGGQILAWSAAITAFEISQRKYFEDVQPASSMR